MANKKTKYFFGLKVLAIIALSCTVTLWAALWISSAIQGGSSGASTDKVTNILDEKFDISGKVEVEKTVRLITLTKSKQTNFCGDTETLAVTILPEGFENLALSFASSDSSIASVDSTGKITYNKIGSAKITATYKGKNQNGEKYTVSDSCNVECSGIKPDKDTKLSFVKYGDNAKNELKSVKVGERATALVNGGETKNYILKYESDNSECVATQGSSVFALSVGKATVTARYKGEIVAKKAIEVTENDDALIPSSVEFTSPEFLPKFILGKMYSVKELVKSITVKRGDGTENTFFCSDDSSVDEFNNALNLLYFRASSDKLMFYGKNVEAKKIGDVKIIISSPHNPNLRYEIGCAVNKAKPESITIVGDSVIVPHSVVKYTATLLPYDYGDNNNLTWKVVKGNASVNEETGTLVSKGYGTIVLRCSSSDFPDVYADYEIKSKLFTTAYGFVRKFMGHGLLSALLGFGIFGSLFLLLKRKLAAIPLTVVSSCVFASVSEFIQYFTPGRFCSFSDMIVDTVGAMCGMMTAITLMLIIGVTWRIISKRSYREFSARVKEFNAKNVFGRTKRYCDCDSAQENKICNEKHDTSSNNDNI